MTRLLVSVRTLDEALLAAAAGVDLIDVKEPTRGPLGMADDAVRRAIGQRLGSDHSLSAACGELHDFVNSRASKGDNIASFNNDSTSSCWHGYRFAKIGLARCASDANWQSHWLAWRSSLPSEVEPVLVCYADGESCGAPTFVELRDFASSANVRWMLFDTWEKRGPGLCQLWQTKEFLRIGQELRRAGLSYVLAGKLTLNDVTPLSSLGAEYLGIRGSVCEPDSSSHDSRCGQLSSEKIKSWLSALKIGRIATQSHEEQ